MKIIGHRGAKGLALENTIESIKAALALPVYAIEFDVRRTRDGKLVLLHDLHTGHVADKTLLVQNTTLSELKKLRLHNQEQIPTLEEVFQLVGDQKPLMLDIKCSGAASEMVRLLETYPKVRVFFTGRQYAELKRLHQALPDVPFLVQNHFDPIEIIHRARAMGAAGISLNKWLINPLTYRLAKHYGLAVYLYTASSPLLVRFLHKLYPDLYLVSNHPERFV